VPEAGIALRRWSGLGWLAALLLSLAWLSSALLRVEESLPRWPAPSAAQGGRLAAHELLARVLAERPGRTVRSMTVWQAPAYPVRIELAAAGPPSRNELVDVDPRSGRALAPSAPRRFFGALQSLQQGLTGSLPGRLALAVAGLVVAVVCATAWRRAHGRGLAWRGGLLLVTAAVLLQLAVVATALDGHAALVAPASRPDAIPSSLDDAWSQFEDAVASSYGRATLHLPLRPDAPLRFDFSEPGAVPGALGRVEIDPRRGEAVTLLHHADLPWLQRWRGNASAWQDGSAFGLPGLVLMSLAAVMMPGFAWGLRRVAAPAQQPEPAVAADGEPPMLVAYASQSGTAENLAQRSAAALRSGGVPALVKDLAELTPRLLRQSRRALFVVATTGSGEPPDHARAFVRRMQAGSQALDLRYGLLALGDRRYEHFCGFGRSVGDWLQRSGAAPLFAPIDVDCGDPVALGQWQSRVRALCGAANDSLAWHEPGFARWRLAARRCLNPGSAGLASFHVELEAVDGADAVWQAGDIAEIRFSDTVREYSIASIPPDGAIHLLVRQTRRDDGSLGIGSGWLTERLAEGEELALRIRSNAGFHAPPDARPLLLIGNGTGLAGLRAHLRARVRAGQHRNWLIFGERNRAHDYYHRNEIEAWLADGRLERLDLAFSRDPPRRVYVQHRLHAAAETLRAWLAEGAAIYVCGSSVGMAPEVEAVLSEVIGADALDTLVAEGRYRRDVY